MQREIITRREAHARGLKRYYDGKPCTHGHNGERFTSNGGCVACQTFSTPNRKKGPRGRNVGWPSVGLVFNVPDVEPHEIEAAFRYIEACGWHDAAVLALRNDPKLLERHLLPLTIKEQIELQSKIERDRRIRAAIRGDE
jgi:hypothetical protein